MPSKRRIELLRADVDVVRFIYHHACQQFGKDRVDEDHTRVWDMWCMMGICREIPSLTGTGSKYLGEGLYVLETWVFPLEEHDAKSMP